MWWQVILDHVNTGNHSRRVRQDGRAKVPDALYQPQQDILSFVSNDSIFYYSLTACPGKEVRLINP